MKDIILTDDKQETLSGRNRIAKIFEESKIDELITEKNTVTSQLSNLDYKWFERSTHAVSGFINTTDRNVIKDAISFVKINKTSRYDFEFFGGRNTAQVKAYINGEVPDIDSFRIKQKAIELASRSFVNKEDVEEYQSTLTLLEQEYFLQCFKQALNKNLIYYVALKNKYKGIKNTLIAIIKKYLGKPFSLYYHTLSSIRKKIHHIDITHNDNNFDSFNNFFSPIINLSIFSKCKKNLLPI